MKIFVLRHGQAEAQQTTDAARNLTFSGRADVAANIQNSLGELAGVQEIWVSPFVRAQQTAEIVQGILSAQGIQLSLKTTELITPESNPNDVVEMLQLGSYQSVLLVSHMPFVGEFLDLLCGSARGTHSMGTSAIALVECDVPAPAYATLQWLRHVSG